MRKGVALQALADKRKVHINTIRNAFKRYRISWFTVPGKNGHKICAAEIRAAARFAVAWDKEHGAGLV